MKNRVFFNSFYTLYNQYLIAMELLLGINGEGLSYLNWLRKGNNDEGPLGSELCFQKDPSFYSLQIVHQISSKSIF